MCAFQNGESTGTPNVSPTAGEKRCCAFFGLSDPLFSCQLIFHDVFVLSFYKTF